MVGILLTFCRAAYREGIPALSKSGMHWHRLLNLLTYSRICCLSWFRWLQGASEAWPRREEHLLEVLLWIEIGFVCEWLRFPKYICLYSFDSLHNPVFKACAFKDRILTWNKSSCSWGPAVCVTGVWVARTLLPTAKTESKSEPKSLRVFQESPLYSVAEPQRGVSWVIKTKPR